MTTSKGDQILIGFLGRGDPGAQRRHRPILEIDHPSHGRESNLNMVKKRWRNDFPKSAFGAAAAHGADEEEEEQAQGAEHEGEEITGREKPVREAEAFAFLRFP